MTDTKHTPGPWNIGEKYQSIIAKHQTGHDDDKSIDAYGGHMICESVKMHANAHLIAAAPDLLEALEDLWDWVLAWWPDFMDYDDFNRLIYEAAIAKAKGQTE